MPIKKVIVLADDPIVKNNLEHHLCKGRHQVVVVGSIAAAQERLAKDNWDLIFADIGRPNGDGAALLQSLRGRPNKPLVVMISNAGSAESAVEYLRDGAFDHLIKPFCDPQIDAILIKCERFNRQSRVSKHLTEDQQAAGIELLGRSRVMKSLRALIRRVAGTDAPVLIQGESGSGKKLVARAIHRQSSRSNDPFIKMNCATIPENQIERELFGDEKGSFTGTMKRRDGRFELAHGGTVLLDEVGEVPSTVQAKLLRLLQERELERVGSKSIIKVDVRVIATTNRHLEESVEKKEFRRDLFSRLNVAPINVPPLRDRREDIVFLAEEFMRRFARKHGVRVPGMSSSCKDALENHGWPGNVRELRNIIERAVILSTDGGCLTPDNPGLRGLSVDTPVNDASHGTTRFNTDGDGNLITLSDLEKRHIYSALDYCKDNRTHAAKILNISIRTLRNKLNEYNGKSKSDSDAEDAVAAEVNG